jgi:hypothetical protein
MRFRPRALDEEEEEEEQLFQEEDKEKDKENARKLDEAPLRNGIGINAKPTTRRVE